ncbi:MAG: hypothetical protein WCI65_11600 [Synechococcaceae cyanobacterium ELA263]
MTKKLSIAGLVVAAAASSAFAFGAAPAQAACLPSDPSATCSTFDPSSTTNVADYAGFSGTFDPADPFVYQQARVQFQLSGTWAPTPFTISGITIQGDGITTTLSFANKTISDNTAVTFDDIQTSWVNLNTSVGAINFANSKISFNFPGGIAPAGGTISARIQYRDTANTQLNTANGTFVSTATGGGGGAGVPGPLPLFGAGAAFGFSRSMRRRIAQSV